MVAVIAIDGPASVGKSTIAKKIAKQFASPILCSGRLYRAVALEIIKKRIDLNNETLVLKVLDNLKYNDLNSLELFSSNVDKVSSEISTKAYLREKLLKYQRAFPIKFGKGKKFTIIEGRDIATVVFPKAKYKIFMWADPKIRAKRRNEQIKKNGGNSSFKRVYNEICARDKKDFNRSIAPLKPDVNSVLIDTSYLDIEQVFNIIKKILLDNKI